jgi:hypothetical protein
MYLANGGMYDNILVRLAQIYRDEGDEEGAKRLEEIREGAMDYLGWDEETRRVYR